LNELNDYQNFSTSDLMLLTGTEKVEDTKHYIILIAHALHNPLRLPWLLKDICTLCLNEEELHDLRLALIRIQVDAELRMNEDIQKFQQRRYVAQVIEILIFQELMLAPKELEGDLE
jgi:hypothetical protein